VCLFTFIHFIYSLMEATMRVVNGVLCTTRSLWESKKYFPFDRARLVGDFYIY